ncbi:hypothetical protein [Deinococcus pimensis]|uniref:hypothetical protein n=1 Tax=Deinococcus pimensis TaxID=309888 RepID=UPI000483D1A5|nr:hypothetical protein [Deinococcus pimensis]
MSDNRGLADVLTYAGYASVAASVAIWLVRGGQSTSPEERAHAERFGIFVGLWAPTFFALAAQTRANREA